MSGILKKVVDGDPLKIPASTYNAFIDAAESNRRRALDVQRGAATAEVKPGQVLVLNDSGNDCDRFGVLAVTGPILTPTENSATFQSRVIVRGDVPGPGDAGRFVVLSEPIEAGKIGRAYIDGVCPAKVRMDDEGHDFADVGDGVYDKLVSGSNGAARLLWIEPVGDRSDPSIAWAIAKLGNEASGAWFWALITGFVSIGPNRWGYAFSALSIDPAKAVAINPDGPAETTSGNYAINMTEAKNTGTGVEGHSVNVDGADYPGGFEVQPVGGRQSYDSGDPGYNTIGTQVAVQMWISRDTNGYAVYTFEYQNADDGTCAAA